MSETGTADLILQAEDVLAPFSELADFIGSFVAFPTPEARDAVALWVAHCHAIEAAATTPRLSIRSPEKQSGKTRLLEVLDLVVPRPILAVNLSVAALFRSIGDPPPSILWDEVDALFRGGNDPGREDLRALLNSGYRRGAEVLRVVTEGKKFEVRSFPTFAPVALAGIGSPPDTISDRSIILELRRRLPDEKVRPFRRVQVEQEAAPIRERVTTWAADRVAELERARPLMPDGLSDRAADLWEPLLAVADLAGGTWPDRARSAAVALAQAGREADGSSGVKLLSDLRDVFAARPDSDHLPSAEVVEALIGLEEAPWGDLRGRPLDARGLARRLRPFGVRPHQVRIGAVTVKGYSRADLVDPWERYCPSPPPGRETRETRETSISAEAPASETLAVTQTGLSETLGRPATPDVSDEGVGVSRDVSDGTELFEINVSDVSDVSVPTGGKGESPREEPVPGRPDLVRLSPEPPVVAMARRYFPGSRYVGTKRHPQPAPDGPEESGAPLSDEGLWASFAAEAGLSA